MISLCKDCENRLFDEWAKIIKAGCSDFWPSEFLAPLTYYGIGIDEIRFEDGMAAHGWYCCLSCQLWTGKLNPLNGLCEECEIK